MHYSEKCKHGYVVRQCRCPGGTPKIVACPEWCKVKSAPPYDWDKEEDD